MSDSDYPAAWKFHSDNGECDGPVFVGRFTGVIEVGTTSYGESPVARFIHEETGEEKSIWLFVQALRDRMVKLAPVEGELVKIEYKGKVKSKTSKYSYQNFAVTAPERPAQELSWGALAVHEEEDDE